MSRFVEILEVGPRDGLQMEKPPFPTAKKVELIKRFLDAGVRRIEVSSFVNPVKVPQMADAEAVMEAIRMYEGAFFTGLVLNRRGLDRAIAAGCNEIGMVIVASETFNRRNQGSSIAESVDAWSDIARVAAAAGVRAQITVSAAFGCPFEGEVPVERVLDIAQRVAEADPYEICFADSIGVGVPTQVSEIVSRARHLLPTTRIRGHFHNTRNTGIANAWAAVEAGVTALDASIGGIGGCPFAPAATGNIPSEDLLYMLHRAGIQTGISLARMIDIARWMELQLGHSVPGALIRAGDFAPVAAA
ncbi:MAG: hydroxymethylglutaryl-CoA lyase [Steroidobacteraceae bacterium]